MGRFLAFSTLAVLLLAGCAGSQPQDSSPPTRQVLGTPRAPLIPAEVPDLCDGTRPAIAHQHPGELATYQIESAIFPCLSKTGAISREPTIGVNSKGTIFHYPAMTGDNTKPTGVAISKDGGATWKLNLPSVGPVPTHPTSTDPYLYLDPITDRVFADDLLTPNCSYFSWTDDEGATWSHSVSGCMETDHQTIFAGKPVTSATRGYPNIVYRCAINLVALGGGSTASTCQNSLDGGLTWMPPGRPAYLTDPAQLPAVCSGALGHGTTDHRGWVYLPKGHCNDPMLAISKDEGLSWTNHKVAKNGVQGHETGVGVDPDGNIYYSWTADDLHPYLAISRDGGATWSEPLMIGPPDLEHAVFPELIVGGVGKVAWVYMGRMAPANASTPRTYEAFIGTTYDALGENPTFYTAAVNDPDVDAFVVGNCCGGVQDFIDVRIGPEGMPWGAFVDDCLGPGVTCKTAMEALDTQREGVAAWLWGGPSLWDEADPNGPYKGP